MNYLLLSNGFNGGAVLDALPTGSPADWCFGEGEPLAAQFPAGGSMQFSPNFMEQKEVFDFVANTMSLLIVSTKVRRILEGLKVDNCEFLPVQLINHRKKVASKEHFVLNLLGHQDIIDMERSTYELHPMKSGQIIYMKNLVVKQDGVEPKALIFRARTMMLQYFLHPAVEEAFVRENVTGYAVRPAEGWDGMPF